MNPLDLVTPGIGLIFWTSVVFLLLVFILKKFAWKPILDAVEKRSDSIEKAINAADEAKASIEQLNIERDKIKKDLYFCRSFFIYQVEILLEIVSHTYTPCSS